LAAIVLLEVLLAAWTEDGQTYHRVTNHNRAILHQNGVKNSHPELLSQHVVDVVVQFAKASVDVFPFPLSAVVKRYFFAMTKQLCVKSAILSLKLLLNGSQSAKRRRNILYENSAKNVPTES